MEKNKIILFSDRLLYWSIVFFPFSMAIAPAFTGIAMGFMFFGYFMNKILLRQSFGIKTPVDTPFLFWLLFSALSIVNSIDYIASARGLLKFAQFGLIYLIISGQVKDKIHLKRIIFSALAGAAFASVNALWQYAFGWDFVRGHELIINIGLKRATAAFPNANVLGVYLSPIAPLAYAFAFYVCKGKKKLMTLAVALLITAGIALTFSRPAALALYVSLLMIGIVRRHKLLLVSLLCLLVISPLIAPKSIKEWARSVDYNPIVFMCNADRISIYRNTVNMISHHPFIGVGLNTFSENYIYYKLPEPEHAATGDTMYAHNNFLHIAGEVGLFGLAMFLWFIVRLFQQCVFLYRRLQDSFLRLVALAIAAGLLAFLVNGLTETNLYYSRVAHLFWILVGLIMFLRKFLDEKRDYPFQS